MGIICKIVSWFIWGCGAIIIAALFLTAGDLIKQLQATPRAPQHPLVDVCLAGAMLVFSIGATILRKRMLGSPKFPGIHEAAGALLWLCLLSFSTCFACASFMLGLAHAASVGNVQMGQISGGLAAAALLFSVPLAPRAVPAN